MTQVLTELDDTLHHQTSTTFNQVATTDHRFMDRYWYSTFAPDGSVGLVFGLAIYMNMNVMDGYGCVVVDRDRQINIRASRVLRPRIDESCVGPIRHDTVAPHRTNRLIVASDDTPVQLDLTFQAGEEPRLEAPHRTLDQGHLVEDYLRLNQNGIVNGTITVEHRTWAASDWYAAKDHSWGVRSHFGGVTIIKPGAPVDDFSGIYIWASWSCGPVQGYVQVQEDGAGNRRFTDSEIVITDGNDRRSVRIHDVEHNVSFTGNSNLYQQMRMTLKAKDGEAFELDIRPAHISFAMIGTGYFDGFSDRRGFGAYRGDDTVETDVYHLSDDGWVTFPDGRQGKPWHREAPSFVTCNGTSGYGYSAAFVEGRVDRYGLELGARSRQGNGIVWKDGQPDSKPGRSQGDAAASAVGAYPDTNSQC